MVDKKDLPLTNTLLANKVIDLAKAVQDVLCPPLWSHGETTQEQRDRLVPMLSGMREQLRDAISARYELDQKLRARHAERAAERADEEADEEVGSIKLPRGLPRFSDEKGAGYLGTKGEKVYIYNRVTVEARVKAYKGLPRDPSDYFHVHREGDTVVTIPVGEWMDTTDELLQRLPRDRDVVFGCSNGITKGMHVSVCNGGGTLDAYWRNSYDGVIKPQNWPRVMILPKVVKA